MYEAIRNGPRGLVEGPLRVWLQSPEFAERAQALGAFCRYGTRLAPRLSELAILVVGAHWRSGFEWHVHAPIAARAGLSETVIAAIRAGDAPDFADADEQTVYAFARELVHSRKVSSAAYARMTQRFGVEAAVELVGVLGYYTLISMTINAFHVPVPEGAEEPFAAPDQGSL